jgi:hypothetical protein
MQEKLCGSSGGKDGEHCLLQCYAVHASRNLSTPRKNQLHSALEMEAENSSEALVDLYKTARHQTTDDSVLQ